MSDSVLSELEKLKRQMTLIIPEYERQQAQLR